MPFSSILVHSLPPTDDTLVQLAERTKLGLSAGAAEKTGRKHLTEGHPNVSAMSSMPRAKIHSLFSNFCTDFCLTLSVSLYEHVLQVTVRVTLSCVSVHVGVSLAGIMHFIS